MTNKKNLYSAPDIYWEEMLVSSVLCESGDVPDYDPITGFTW